jgi:trk system potassium uptake protein TrkA
MKILIVGGGVVTEQLLNSINLKKNQAVVIEKDPDRCSSLSSKYDVLVINKDATNVSVYSDDISMSEFEALLALTDKDEVNIFTLTVAKLYKVPFRLARVKNPKVAELITRLQLGVPISHSSIIADMVRSYLSALGEAKPVGHFKEYTIYAITLSETDKVINKKVGEIALPDDVSILLMFDGNRFRVPKEDDILLNGYQLLVMAKTSNVNEIFKG